MILEVNSKDLQQAYNSIWQHNWQLEGYTDGETVDNILQQVIFQQKGNDAGSLELKKLNIKDENEESDFRFFEHEHIKKDKNHIVEIDKLSILPAFRGQHLLDLILSHITYVAEEKDIRQYVARISRELFLALKGDYKIPVVRLGPNYEYFGDLVVPMSIDPRLVYRNKEQYSFLLSKEEYKEVIEQPLKAL